MLNLGSSKLNTTEVVKLDLVNINYFYIFLKIPRAIKLITVAFRQKWKYWGFGPDQIKDVITLKVSKKSGFLRGIRGLVEMTSL